MKKQNKEYSLKEAVFISFSFWPTMLIGVALGMTISLLLILNINNFEQLVALVTYPIIGLIIVGVAFRFVTIYLWKKYDCRFSSDMK